MKKVIILSITFLGIFLCIYSNPVITKNKDKSELNEKYAVNDCTILTDLNESLTTIRIKFNKPSDDVHVYIYKDGNIVFEDTDQVQTGTNINYSINDPEKGIYDIVVESDGKLVTMDSMWIGK